jgi:RNA polymerase sigma factor (sigma-70 family)
MELRPEIGQLAGAPERLLDRVRQKDETAMVQLVAAHDGEMVRLAYLVSGDRELARDATQEAWHRLWHSPPRLRDESRLRSWLLSVAANEARQQLRRRQVGRVKEISAHRPTARLDDGSTDLRLDLQAALTRLTPDERELIGLRFVLGMSSAEVGAHLGLSAEGARSRLHRAVVRLRRELGDD